MTRKVITFILTTSFIAIYGVLLFMVYLFIGGPLIGFLEISRRGGVIAIGLYMQILILYFIYFNKYNIKILKKLLAITLGMFSFIIVGIIADVIIYTGAFRQHISTIHYLFAWIINTAISCFITALIFGRFARSSSKS